MTALLVAVLNGLGAVLPQIPALVSEIRDSQDLTAAGAALLDRLSGDVAAVDAVPPLDVPPPKPTV